jgi:hypothetical protein
MELLWTLAVRSADVLIEANFRPHSDRERSKLSALGGHPVEVHCACPAVEATAAGHGVTPGAVPARPRAGRAARRNANPREIP